MRHVENRFDVDVKDAVEGSLIDIEHGLAAVRGARVVDHDVRHAEGIDAGLHGSLHVGRFRYVTSHCARGRPEVGSDLGGFGSVEVGNHHTSALRHKQAGNALAKSTRRASDQRNFSF